MVLSSCINIKCHTDWQRSFDGLGAKVYSKSVLNKIFFLLQVFNFCFYL